MHLNTSDVQYILAKFDAGVPPHRILIGLQYRAFLPTAIDIATIENCLYDNGRLMKIHQAATTTKDDQALGFGHTSDPLLPPAANEGAPAGLAATTQEAHRQLPSTGLAMGNLATDQLVDSGPMLPWDAQADDFALTAYQASKSRDEIWTTLRNRGYDITPADVVTSLVRQGVRT